MKKDTSRIIALTAGLTAIIAVIGISITTFAQDEGFGRAFWGRGRGMGLKADSAQHEAMEEAFKNNDYEAWKELMADRPGVQEVTEEQFANLAKVHALMAEGKLEEARELQKELGLKIGLMKGLKGINKGFGLENKEAIEEAIANNDYEAWKEAMGENPVVEKITADNFFKLMEMYNLKQAGDMEGAKAIAEELNIGFGNMGYKKGFHKFIDKNGDGVCDYRKE